MIFPIQKLTFFVATVALVSACAQHGGGSRADTEPTAPPSSQAQPAPSQAQAPVAAPVAPAQDPALALEQIGCKFSESNDKTSDGITLDCKQPAKLAALDGLIDKVGKFLGLAKPEEKDKKAAAAAYLAKLNAARDQRSQKAAGVTATITTELTSLTQSGCGFTSQGFTCPAEPSPLKLLKRNAAMSRLIKAMHQAPIDIDMSSDDEADNASKITALNAAAAVMQKTYQAELTTTSAKISEIVKRIDALADALGDMLNIKVLVPDDCFADTVAAPEAQCQKVETNLMAVTAQLSAPAMLKNAKDRHIDLLTIHFKSAGVLKVSKPYSPERVSENIEIWVSQPSQVAAAISSVPKRGQAADSEWLTQSKLYASVLNDVSEFFKPLPIAIDASADTFSDQTPALQNLLAALKIAGHFKLVSMSKLWLGILDSSNPDGAFFDAPTGATLDGEFEFNSHTSIPTLVTELKKLKSP